MSTFYEHHKRILKDKLQMRFRLLINAASPGLGGNKTDQEDPAILPHRP